MNHIDHRIFLLIYLNLRCIKLGRIKLFIDDFIFSRHHNLTHFKKRSSFNIQTLTLFTFIHHTGFSKSNREVQHVLVCINNAQIYLKSNYRLNLAPVIIFNQNYKIINHKYLMILI